MEDEEVQRLVDERRASLRETGFGWAAEQAEALLSADAPSRIVAHALIDAAEAVTVELAQAELATIRRLGVEEIVFKIDPGADSGPEGTDEENGGDYGRPIYMAETGVPAADGDRLRGQQRRAAGDSMRADCAAVGKLRDRLRGVV